jgi:hypothetical protein
MVSPSPNLGGGGGGGGLKRSLEEVQSQAKWLNRNLLGVRTQKFHFALEIDRAAMD